METLLNFFSDLILFTAGLAVVLLWLVVLLAIAIEIVDSIKERGETDVDLDEEPDQ